MITNPFKKIKELTSNGADGDGWRTMPGKYLASVSEEMLISQIASLMQGQSAAGVRNKQSGRHCLVPKLTSS